MKAFISQAQAYLKNYSFGIIFIFGFISTAAKYCSGDVPLYLPIGLGIVALLEFVVPITWRKNFLIKILSPYWVSVMFGGVGTITLWIMLISHDYQRGLLLIALFSFVFLSLTLRVKVEKLEHSRKEKSMDHSN